jgi:hypothetical protein
MSLVEGNSVKCFSNLSYLSQIKNSKVWESRTAASIQNKDWLPPMLLNGMKITISKDGKSTHN